MSDTAYHEPVMLAEVLKFLDGARRVFDGTLGGGGHTAALLERGASVVGVDRDPAARDVAAQRLAKYVADGKLTVVASTFADAAVAEDLGGPFDGVLLDLGVSSRQLDDESRGFSFREGALLDMRMGDGETVGQRDGDDVSPSPSLTQSLSRRPPVPPSPSAADWLNTAPESELSRAFIEYADERKGRRLAHIIAQRRLNRPFATSDDLVGAIRAALGPRSGAPDFARLFQAVRIAVNDELGELARALPALRDRLVPGGVFVVISYHSGEDRLVKHAFQDWSRACVCPPRQPICTCGGVAKGELVTRKPIEASEAEVAVNVRARSAKLRAWRSGIGYRASGIGGVGPRSPIPPVPDTRYPIPE